MDLDEQNKISLELWVKRGYSRRRVEREWRHRTGLFQDCDKSTPERLDVMPVPPPPVKEQTEPWARGDDDS